MSNDQNTLNKAGWTGVEWVSEKFNVKEHGLRLKQTVKEFDYYSCRTLSCGERATPRPRTDDLQCKNSARKRKRGRPTHELEHENRDPEIKQLGFDEELDLGWGEVSCFSTSTLLSETSISANTLEQKRKLHLTLDLHLEESSYLKAKKMCSLIPESSQMKTVECRKLYAERERKSRRYRGKYKPSTIQTFAAFNPNAAADLVPEETIVVVVRVYWPFARMFRKRSLHEMKFSQEIVMLSTQTLDQLRDLIMCVTDTVVPGECSNNPRNVPDHTAKDVYKSGFFFIENAFYNDYRHPDNIDYSEVIQQWAFQRNIVGLCSYTMGGTKMEDLTIRLGYPYVYQHQGNCEHLFTISDVRLLHPSESNSLSSYPYVLHQSRPRMQFCFMCGKLAARWLTEDNMRVPFTPCYFCDKCFHSFNYIDGKKVGSFKAYYFREPILTP